MNSKTMEGLVGARININMTNTPLRVYKEARRRGDTATMERAMGYVSDFSEKAGEYKTEADKGMEEEAKEVREKAEEAREKAELEREDAVEISEEGKALLKDNTDSDGIDSGEKETDAIKEPVTDTKQEMQQGAGISVLV